MAAVFDAESPSPRQPPPPPNVPGMNNPRYVYLLTRLRNRQITMEEATELFAIQQAMIRAGPPPPPPPIGLTSPSSTARSASSTPTGFLGSDDNLALAILGLGAGAGLVAALLRRAREGPKESDGELYPSRKSAAPPP